MKINSGSPNFNANNINSVKEQQEKSLERLVTGLKINSAADDAAGLQIANRLFAQASGTQVAIRNANDAYSYASVADSALSGINDASQRVNELSLQAANGTLNASDRQAIQQEITQIQQQVSDIQANTSFAGQSLFGSSENRNFQVGANAGQQIGLSSRTLNDQISQLKSIDVTSQSGAQQGIETSQAVSEQITQSRGEIGAFQNRISSTINSLNNTYENTEAARSRIEDTDFARETANLTQQGIRSNISTAIAAQANSDRAIATALLGD